jgi:hypothetical protein
MMAWEPPLSQSDHVSPSAGPLQLDVLPLGVLFEKFYPHEATDQRDKVFALLGLCHHVHASSTLPLPDYTKSWWTIVTELVRYSLGPLVAMTTGEHEEQIIITGHGWPIGKVTDISTDRISITCSHFSGPQNGDDNCETSIDREGRHREIQLNDILWQMDGAPFPCMVRHHYDHFLVVNLSIPASRFLLRWQWERLIMDDPDMWQSESNRSRRITLVWTMGSIPYQTRSFQLSRARVEINDVMHPGRDRRLLECARILDDVNDENGLKATIDNWHGTDDQWHFQLLTLAHSHWASYQWLKKFCETLRWIVYRLGSWQQGQNTTYKHLREYWKSEGYLAFDILEIDDLFKKQSKQMQPPAAHDLWNAPTKFSNGWDYGAQNHSKFLSLFFRQHSKPWPNSTHEQGTRCGRYVIHLMLPDPKLPNGPVHAPKTMLDAMIRAGYRIEHSVNLHLIVFGVISETRQNKLRLPKRILHSLVNCPRGADILSFLLAESYRDVRLIYKILQVAIERECRPHVIELVPRSDRYYERRAEHQRRPDHDFADRSGTPEALPSRHMLMASWLHENIRVLEAYIRHTDICKVAHSAKNDTVLLTLLAVFSYIDGTDYKHSQLSSETSREMILKGMSQFLEEHNVITMTLSRRTKRKTRTLEYIRGEWPGDDFKGTCHVEPSDLWSPERGICMMRALWKEYKEVSKNLCVKDSVRWVEEQGVVTAREKGRVRERLEEAFEAYAWGTTPLQDETPAGSSFPIRPMSPDYVDHASPEYTSSSSSSEQDSTKDNRDLDATTMEPLRSSQQLPHRSVSKNFQRSMYHYRPHVLLEKWAFPASENEHTMSDPGGNGNSSYYDASDGESSDYSNPIQENESPAAEASGVIADVLRSWKA